MSSKRQKQSTVPDTLNLHQIEAWASLVGNEIRRDGRSLSSRGRLRDVLKEGKATMRMDFDTDVIEMAAELFGAAYAQDPRTEEEFTRDWNAAVADILRTHPHTRIETIAYAAGVAMGRFHRVRGAIGARRGRVRPRGSSKAEEMGVTNRITIEPAVIRGERGQRSRTFNLRRPAELRGGKCRFAVEPARAKFWTSCKDCTVTTTNLASVGSWCHRGPFVLAGISK